MISFGPIPSRRLGKSLGINNILSPKYCSYACVYCQVGKTRHYCIDRRTFFKPELIYRQVSHHLKKLDNAHRPDYLTFVANGEPGLDKHLSESIHLLRELNIPIAIITNASLLYKEDVAEDLMLADWVSLKVDAPDVSTWQRMNKPQQQLNFETCLSSIVAFSKKFQGVLCTETMLVSGINDSMATLEATAGIIHTLNPYKAYISIPIRPPACFGVKAPPAEVLNMAWNVFSKKLINTELLTGFEGTNAGYTGNAREDILNITAVHPLREDTMNELLKNDNADHEVLISLIHEGYVKQLKYNEEYYYLRNYGHSGALNRNNHR